MATTTQTKHDALKDQLKERATALRESGLNNLQIAGELGIDKNRVQSLLGKKSGPRKNDLDRNNWLLFVSELTDVDEGGYITVNHVRLGDDTPVQRQFFRWQDEDAETNPTLWGADEFLVGVGLHLNIWFDWCEAHERCAWAKGEAPDWHEAEPNWNAIDKTWTETDAQGPS